MANRRVLIIEDNPHELEQLKDMLSKNPEFSEFEIIGEAETTAKGLRLIKKFNPDGIFLDIHIQTEGKKAGLDLAIELNKLANRPWIIFITGEAKKHSSEITEKNIHHEGFIKKLFHNEDITNCLSWIKQKYPINNKRIEVKHRVVHCGEKIWFTSFIKPEEIIYIEKNNSENTTKIHIRDNCKDLDEIQHTIDYWKNELIANNIIRIQNSILVNLHHISSYDKVNRRVHIKCCCLQELPVGRTFADDFFLAWRNFQ